jgi:hypothetical protein
MLSTHVNVGPDTAPDTFTFTHNLWTSMPTLPVTEDGGIYGVASGYYVDGNGLSNTLCSAAPEAQAGIALSDDNGTYFGDCRGTGGSPSIGPLEAQSCTD